MPAVVEISFIDLWAMLPLDEVSCINVIFGVG
jgi:hypothetical protein